MLSFIGDYTCKLDSKGRAVGSGCFPEGNAGGGRGVVCDAADIFDECIDVYPKDEWIEVDRGIEGEVEPV